jgi:hypothetical protein
MVRRISGTQSGPSLHALVLICPLSLQQPVKRRPKRRWSRAERERAAEKQLDDSRLYNLTLDVNALRQEIRGAAQQRAMEETRARATREGAEKDLRALASQFAQLFVDKSQGSSGFTPCFSPSTMPTLEDAAFVSTHVHERLVLNAEHVGQLGLLSRTRALAQLFQVHSARIQSMCVLSDRDTDSNHTIAECHIELTGRLTRRSIALAFPSSLKHPELASEALLLGSQRLRCSLRAVLFVQPQCHLITMGTLTLDLLPCLLSMLPRSGLLGVAVMLDKSPFDASGLPSAHVLDTISSTMDKQDGVEDGERSHASPLSPLSIKSPRNRHAIEFLLSPTA